MADDPTPEPKPDPEPAKTFTQSDVDRIIADRLKREAGKYSDYDDLKAKADKLDELEKKNQSEVDRLSEQVAALTSERDAAATRADRLEVAVTKSLAEDQAKRITSAAKRLTGSTREELEADADEFLTAFAQPEPKPDPEPDPEPPRGRSKEQLTPGATPGAAPPDVKPGMARLRHAYETADK